MRDHHPAAHQGGMDTITRKKTTGEPGNPGQFGSKTHSEATTSLTEMAPPTMARVTLEHANEDGTAIDSRRQFDANLTPALDQLDMDAIYDLQELGGTRQLFDEAQRLCLVPQHDSPLFNVSLDQEQLDAYAEHRLATGQEEGRHSFADPARMERQIESVDRQITELREHGQRLRLERLRGVIAEKLPDAASFTLDDPGDIDGDPAPNVDRIYDADGNVIWDLFDTDDDDDDIVDALKGYVVDTRAPFRVFPD